jgi:hypothetical protein
MTDAERLHFATKLTARLDALYPHKIQLALIDGSTARLDGTDYSDVELRLITSEPVKCPLHVGDTIIRLKHGDIIANVEFVTRDAVVTLISQPVPEWPVKVWTYLEPQVVGTTNETTRQIIADFRSATDKLKRADFANAIRSCLAQGFNNLCKVRTGVVKRIPCVTFGGARHLVWNAAMLVALENQQFYHFGDCRVLNEARCFAKLPAGFITDCEVLYGCRDTKVIGRAAESLWENCSHLAETNGHFVWTMADLDGLASDPFGSDRQSSTAILPQ